MPKTNNKKKELRKLARKVLKYVDGASDRKLLPHRPEEYGVWRVYGGLDGSPERKKMRHELVSGYYMGAVADAIRNQRFYAHPKRSRNPGREDSGYVERANCARDGENIHFVKRRDGLLEIVQELYNQRD